MPTDCLGDVFQRWAIDVSWKSIDIEKFPLNDLKAGDFLSLPHIASIEQHILATRCTLVEKYGEKLSRRGQFEPAFLR